MKLNEQIHGFTVTRVREMRDCNGTLVEMKHDQTGAELCWLDRKDTNMTFSVAFKTTPENDTGVFHILEHSVLCGSEKYPVREPFVELLKGSMQTFLNAMTYPDKTLYPISTRNKKDYMNLMSVYMDAVFHPALVTNPNIFYQEGWHYEIRKPDEEPVYKGVVFNEMKGAFSSVDETVVNELNRMLFPDNCYRYVSGGDPEKIPELSYEQFLKTHATYYHPSNARFFLDGDVEIDSVLAFIHDAYLSKYEALKMDFHIPMQAEVPASTHTYAYEIAEGEDTKDKTIAALAKIVSRFDDVEQSIAWNALSTVLTGTNESPFKQAILSRNLGQDVELYLYDGIQQPWAMILVRNTNEDQAETALQVLKDTAKELLKNGLNRDAILASINQLQFQYLEKKEPAGIINASSALSSWLYEGDPALYLNCGEVYETLKKKVAEGYFEHLLEEFLLDEEHLSTVIAVPGADVAKIRLEREKQALVQAKESWKDVQKYIAINESLDRWQATPDTPEQLATLPALKLEDIDPKPSRFDPEVKQIGGADVLIYPRVDTGITYINLYFSLAGIKREQLSAVSLFADLLKDLPTSEHTVEELQSEIQRDLGVLSFGVTVQQNPESRFSSIPLFCVSCSVLEANRESAENRIEEILKKTRFTKESIQPLLKQRLDGFRQALIGAGHSIAVLRASAHLSSDAVGREFVSGYEKGMFLKELDEEETKLEQFIEDATLFQNILFARSRMTISFTDPSITKEMESFIRRFEMTDARRGTVRYPLLEGTKEGIVIPSQVSYSAYGANLQNADGEYDGSYRVLGHILTYGYLWNEVRVKGGAYGTGISVGANSNIVCWSYRDPNPNATQQINKGCGASIESLMEETSDLSSYIIGTIAETEPLLTPSGRIALRDMQYFAGIDYDRLCGRRTEILTTEKEDLLHDAQVLSKAYETGVSCVVSSAEIVAQCDLSEEEIHNPF